MAELDFASEAAIASNPASGPSRTSSLSRPTSKPPTPTAEKSNSGSFFARKPAAAASGPSVSGNTTPTRACAGWPAPFSAAE